ncbi:hemin ABC transporter ATP-binding protein, partial [Nocardia cyriacigeorgica]|nr:hemin ABC transporter ATP-binding protein [Nocardia cyriacigeorgica]
MTGLKAGLDTVFARAHELPAAPDRGSVTLRASGVSVDRRGGGAKVRRVL